MEGEGKSTEVTKAKMGSSLNEVKLLTLEECGLSEVRRFDIEAMANCEVPLQTRTRIESVAADICSILSKII